MWSNNNKYGNNKEKFQSIYNILGQPGEERAEQKRPSSGFFCHDLSPYLCYCTLIQQIKRDQEQVSGFVEE